MYLNVFLFGLGLGSVSEDQGSSSQRWRRWLATPRPGAPSWASDDRHGHYKDQDDLLTEERHDNSSQTEVGTTTTILRARIFPDMTRTVIKSEP